MRFRRGDAIAWIGPVQRVLGPCRPRDVSGSSSRACDIGSRGIPAPGLPELNAQLLGLRELVGERCFQSQITCQTEHVVDAVRLAPTHQLIVAEPTVCPQGYAHARPGCSGSARPVAPSFFDRASAAGNVRTPLPGQQQVPAAELP